MSAMASQGNYLGPCFGVPNSNRAVPCRCGSQPLGVGTPVHCKKVKGGVFSKREKFLAAGRIPYFGRVIMPGRSQASAVWTTGDAMNIRLMTAQGANFLAGGRVPNPDRHIPGG